jgi:hypothetical protein
MKQPLVELRVPSRCRGDHSGAELRHGSGADQPDSALRLSSAIRAPVDPGGMSRWPSAATRDLASHFTIVSSSVRTSFLPLLRRARQTQHTEFGSAPAFATNFTHITTDFIYHFSSVKQ